MRRSRNQAALVRRYSEVTGRPLRTAQHHAKHNHPEWLQFVTSGAGEPLTAAEPVPAEIGPSSPLERARLLVEQQWQALQQSNAQRASAANPALIAAWANACALNQRSYREAVRELERLMVAEGLLVPAERIAELEREFVAPLRESMRTMSQEVGPEANPIDPRRGIEACQRWVAAKFLPVLASISGQITVEKNSADSEKGHGGES